MERVTNHEVLGRVSEADLLYKNKVRRRNKCI